MAANDNDINSQDDHGLTQLHRCNWLKMGQFRASMGGFERVFEQG